MNLVKVPTRYGDNKFLVVNTEQIVYIEDCGAYCDLVMSNHPTQTVTVACTYPQLLDIIYDHKLIKETL